MIGRIYWRLRAAWARWRMRHNPRPSLDELLQRIYGSPNKTGSDPPSVSQNAAAEAGDV